MLIDIDGGLTSRGKRRLGGGGPVHGARGGL